MNYLGHLLATYPHKRLTLGNLAGDLIRNGQISGLHTQVQKGVQVHRAIDQFTDQHPAIRDVVRQLRPVHHKYAPVVVDVIMDYVLISDWDYYTDMAFESLTSWVYDIVDTEAHLLPGQVANRLAGMRAHQWLDQYGTQSGLLHVLQHMDTRARFPSRFAEAIKDVNVHYEMLKEGLRSFYPDLQSFTADLISET